MASDAGSCSGVVAPAARQLAATHWRLTRPPTSIISAASRPSRPTPSRLHCRLSDMDFMARRLMLAASSEGPASSAAGEVQKHSSAAEKGDSAATSTSAVQLRRDMRGSAAAALPSGSSSSRMRFKPPEGARCRPEPEASEAEPPEAVTPVLPEVVGGLAERALRAGRPPSVLRRRPGAPAGGSTAGSADSAPSHAGSAGSPR